MTVLMDLTTRETSPVKIPDRQRILSVLYVDDDPALLTIGKIYLERCPGIFVTTANGVKKALGMLETLNFDVILSDYQMPGIDGIGFLKILQKRGCPIPFILFTGKGREEVVIEAINNGATYYIQKGGDPKAQFAELEHKIREASRRRHAETALREIELQYRTLFEYSGTAVITLEDDLLIACANSGFCELTGYSRDEIEGRLHWTDVIAADEIGKLRDHFHDLRNGRIPAISGFEVQIIAKDRQIRKTSATAARIPSTGKCLASLVYRTDGYPSGEIVHKKSEGHYRMIDMVQS